MWPGVCWLPTWGILDEKYTCSEPWNKWSYLPRDVEHFVKIDAQTNDKATPVYTVQVLLFEVRITRWSLGLPIYINLSRRLHFLKESMNNFPFTLKSCSTYNINNCLSIVEHLAFCIVCFLGAHSFPRVHYTIIHL